MRTLYVALGDSITAGHGATHSNLAFVPQISRILGESGQCTRTIVLAQNGWDTQTVQQAATVIPRTLWEQTSVLTLMTGGNDLRKLLRRQYFSLSGDSISPMHITRTLEQFEYTMDNLCAWIAQLQIPRVVVATVYNPVPNYPLAVHAMRSLHSITTLLVARYRFALADVYTAFLGHEMHYIHGYTSGRIEDLSTPFRKPIHPTDQGHHQIAKLITTQLTSSLPTPPDLSVPLRDDLPPKRARILRSRTTPQQRRRIKGKH